MSISGTWNSSYMCTLQKPTDPGKSLVGLANLFSFSLGILILIIIVLSLTWNFVNRLKGLWHASAHVRQLDFCSGEQFFKIGVLVKKSSSIDPETPEKAIISVFKSYWFIWEVLNAIFSIFVQVLSRKFKVIEENRTKPSSLLSVFLQTDQMWSSGFHFCLLRFFSQRSTFEGYFLNDKYVKRVKKGFLDTALDY